MRLSKLAWPALARAICACAMATGMSTPVGAESARILVHRTPHDALFDLAFDGKQGVAVGAFGAIYASQDAGANWQRQDDANPPVALLGVAARGGRCLAVGQRGTVVRSDDCLVWKPVASGTTSRLNAVSMNQAGLSFAVGAFGSVFKSADWGATWQPVQVDWASLGKFPGEPHLYGVHVDAAGTVTVAGEFELIVRSANGGERWKVLNRGARSLFGLKLRDDGLGAAVGQNGAVLLTRDGGASWRPVASGSDSILTGIDIAADGRAVATGINTVLLSRDGGLHWQALPSKLTQRGWQQAAAMAMRGTAPSAIYTAGAGGTILEINDKETR